jgi:O-antigen ligase
MRAAVRKFPLEKLVKLVWALFLVFLPVTSFPFFPPAMGGGALVRPLSIFPLLVLLALVTLPRLLTRPIPRTLIALVPFALAALASSLLSLLQGVEPSLGVPVAERLARALITLGIGGAIYFSVALIPRSPQELRASLRWLYAGFGIALLWGSLQAIYVVHFSPAFFKWISEIQRFISTRRLFNMRVSGMTYEPNWFAEQISFLLLPWLLSAVLTGYSAFRWRWRWLTLEWFMLAWALLVLPFTFSRAGLAVLVALTFVGILFFRPKRPASSQKKHTARLPGWARRAIEAGAVVLVLAGFIFFAGAKNTFFSRIWDYWSDIKETSLTGYFEYLGFGARFTYSETALRIYQEHPVFGVGLGNYAFYFEEMLPDRPLAQTPEVLRLVTPDVGRDRLITPKNLYFRLLAETGLVGMAFFLGFVTAILGCALYLWLASDRDQRFWGTAGLLGLLAFALSAFSYDSFAIPNMWVVFGLITAAAWVYRSQPEPQTDEQAQPQRLPE